jgi:hypothetical protein
VQDTNDVTTRPMRRTRCLLELFDCIKTMTFHVV